MMAMEKKSTEHFVHSCGRKIRYISKSAAKTARDTMRAKTGQVFSAYKCWYCSGWHIGHRWSHKFLKDEDDIPAVIPPGDVPGSSSND